MLERNCFTVLQYQTEAKKKLELCEKKLLEVIAKSLGIVKPAPAETNVIAIKENAPRMSITEIKKPPSPAAKSPEGKPPLPPAKESEKDDIGKAEKATTDDYMPVQDPWLVRMDSYQPTIYTSKSILANLNADLDLFS